MENRWGKLIHQVFCDGIGCPKITLNIKLVETGVAAATTTVRFGWGTASRNEPNPESANVVT